MQKKLFGDDRVFLFGSEEKVSLFSGEEKVSLFSSEEKVSLFAKEERIGITGLTIKAHASKVFSNFFRLLHRRGYRP